MNNLAAIMKLDFELRDDFIVYKASEKNSKNVNYTNILPYFLWYCNMWMKAIIINIQQTQPLNLALP